MQIIKWAQDNWQAIVVAQQALFVALSLICQLFGWTAASKFFGTYSTLDLGRIARGKQLKAGVVNGAIFVALLTTGCGVFGKPEVKTGVCFKYCLITPVTFGDASPALCFDQESEMLKTKRQLEAQGIAVQVRK